MFIFSIFVPPDKNQQKYAETATCFRSLGENSPEDPAQVKERPTWRSIAKSRALYDQMAPQLCLFYISAKFDVRPQHAELIWCFFDDSWPPLYIFSIFSVSWGIIGKSSVFAWSDESRTWPKCKRGITGVPFGRIELSIWLWTSKSGALWFGPGPVGCFLQGRGNR